MNMYSYLRSKQQVRSVFAGFAIAALIISAFPGGIALAIVPAGASVSTQNGAPVVVVDDELPLTATRGGVLSSSGAVTVSLSSANGGEFSGGNSSGNCTGGFSANGSVTITGTTQNKAFCYKNENPGPDIITAVFSIDEEEETVEFEVTVTDDDEVDTSVTYCKATGNENNLSWNENSITPAEAQGSYDASTGLYGSGVNQFNIIPPIGGIPGLNWDDEGQAIWNDGACDGVYNEGGDGDGEVSTGLLKIVKEVVGGTAVPSDWTMSATASGNEFDFQDSGDSSEFHVVAADIVYAMSESDVSGYTLTDISCVGSTASQDGNLGWNDIIVGEDDEVTCTFTNTHDEDGSGGGEGIEFCSYAGKVVETTPDEDVTVDANRRDVTAVEISPASYQNTSGKEGNDWVVGDFFSLGLGGFLTYEFTGQVAEGDGTSAADIAIYEITGGTGANTEKIEVFVSEDGVSYTSVGTFTGDAYVDIDSAGLDQVRFVKVVDQSANGDGYDVDAIVILNGNCANPNEPPAPIEIIEVCKFVGEVGKADWEITLTNGNSEDDIQASTEEDGCVEIEFDPTKGPWNIIEEAGDGYAQVAVEADGGPFMSVVSNTDGDELYPEMCQFALPEEGEDDGDESLSLDLLAGLPSILNFAIVAPPESSEPEFSCTFTNMIDKTEEDEDGDGASNDEENTSDRRSSGSTGTRIASRVAAPQGQVLGAADSLQKCEMFITDYMRTGEASNRQQVVRLQAFLMGYMGYDVDLTGEFDAATETAVRNFQAEYQDEILTPWMEAGLMSHNNPTGYAYMLTRWKINNLMCPGSEPYPAELR